MWARAMQISELPPSQLSLDRSNPRFGLSQAADEQEALEFLYDTADLKELWDSIAERGFEKFEPLVGTREDGEIVILEGNRRLAAVKLLLEPDLLKRENARKRIPSIPPELLDTCRILPVIIVKNRAEAAGYIGFKHVNGPARWSSLAKAKFGVKFFESLASSLTPQERMKSLTRQLGDSRGLIIRLLVAYKIIEQSLNLGLFDELGIEESDIEFSHLYTLINNPDSRAFIGISKAPLSESMIKDAPIPETHRSQLRELLSWLYGKRSVIKSQGVDRPKLQKVLANEDGLRELRTTGNLAAAEAVSGLLYEEWLELLAKISAMTSKAATDAPVVVPELSADSLDQANKIIRRIRTYIGQINSVTTPEP